MSGLAIAFPVEIAANVAEAVVEDAPMIGVLLLVLSVALGLLFVCKPYATRIADALRERLVH
jgi:hypothetical protein